MGSSEVSENRVVRNRNGIKSHGEDDLEGMTNGGCEQMVNGAKENENLGDEILEDFDTYWEDVNDRLMVSRMVSDSVIKGIVSAVEQEAAERLLDKHRELTNLKEYLQFHEGGLSTTEFESLGSLMSQDELENMIFRKRMTLSDVFMEHGKMGDFLDGLRSLAKDECKKLKKSIDELRRSNSIWNRSSHVEMVELEGILQEEESGIWVQLDKPLDNMRMMVDTIFKRMDVMLQLSKTSLGQWQEEHLIEVELEAMVMRSVVRTVQEEFEYKLWDQYAQLCGDRNEKLNAISSLRTELDAVLKSLSSSENGHATSHGSHDADFFSRKTASEFVTSSKSVCDGNGNGKLEDSMTDIPENFDAVTLKHMSKDEMVTYFNNIMTKMKRHHESVLQKKTDEYFVLRAEYLNLRGGSAVPHKKVKGESDILGKKISEIIFKLDDILVENEKHPAFTQETLSFGNLKDRLDNLLSENHQLRDLLKDKKYEVKSLLSQVSDATEKRPQHSLAEAGMLKQIRDLNLAMEESLIEASVREDVYTCFLRGLGGGERNEVEELNLGFDMLNESNDTNTGSARKIEIEDLEMECQIMQEICGVISGEGIKEAKAMLQELYWEHLNEKEIRISLDTKIIEMENKLKFEVEEKDRLSILVKEKEKLVTDASAALAKERDQFEQASQELNAAKEFASKQQTLASRCNKEINVVKGLLAEAMEQIEVLKEEAAQLNKSLEEKAEELKEANHRANMVLAVSEERQTLLSSLESKEIELRKQVETIIGNINELSKMVADFECRVTGRLRTNNARFEHSYSQLDSLVKKANLLRRTTLLYQQRLEKRCSDFQLAEAEVDLLGDEVDTLLSLVEKIYIALDHYSPVLQHYPGIMEILKVIKRELTGESTKLVKSSPA
ncbi:WPP domain-associated protein isoform X2 [Solanum dulcamara]|uniref:WPP domain-associated protein isoform X2 n=1 Tax=Solanum dulcamara TaxID=45834 RepID=UPI0024851F15|nr:WPP domain-associated protein isoform X2 [Solanum dulcamara]